ncbi:hypothetical protein Dsin_002949 [Dipteronia sinensis]|uniref:Uncharacterized protein n=1 Tax=Dipteronia sinensis TaxID=43782 RepID=A0AAE0EJR9_9ROSI|nr:hypothetical protein Dsin_002949 [Dipteronia sinensis]
MKSWQNELLEGKRLRLKLQLSVFWTALHCAAIKGRIDVIRHLLSCRPESAKELTYKGETMLHLVVKNSQGVQIMTPLISILGELNLVEDHINCVDEDGNTVLHLVLGSGLYSQVNPM